MKEMTCAFFGRVEVVGREEWEGSNGNVSATKGNGTPSSGTAGRRAEKLTND